MRYAVVYEQTPNNYAAYVPDLPGCIATGKTHDEVERLIGEGIRLHLELMRESDEQSRLPRRPWDRSKRICPLAEPTAKKAGSLGRGFPQVAKGGQVRVGASPFGRKAGR